MPPQPKSVRGVFWKKDVVAGYFWLAVWFWAACINTLPWSARRLTWTVLIKEQLITLLLEFWPSEARMWTCKSPGGPLLGHPVLTQRMCQCCHPSDLTAPYLVLLVPTATTSFSGYRSLLLRCWGWLTQSLLRGQFSELSWYFYIILASFFLASVILWKWGVTGGIDITAFF